MAETAGSFQCDAFTDARQNFHRQLDNRLTVLLAIVLWSKGPHSKGVAPSRKDQVVSWMA